MSEEVGRTSPYFRNTERWPSLARLLVNAGITKVISGHTGTSLVTFNDHAHLETDRTLITYR